MFFQVVFSTLPGLPSIRVVQTAHRQATPLRSHSSTRPSGGVFHYRGGDIIAGVVGGWSSWVDPRIKAALLFSPYMIPFQLHSTVGAIGVPVMYQGAQGDFPLTNFLQGNTGAYALSNSPKFFLELNGGSHLEWTNVLCLNIPTVADCLQQKPNAQLIDNYSEAFLDRYSNQSSQSLLTGTGSSLAA